jgi:epoxyqueuosine reductase
VTADLASDIKSFGLNELDFDLVGITSARPLAGGARLQEWLSDGRHGEMAYMARNVATRCDPARLLPGARSVICVAMSYHDTPNKRSAPAPDADRVTVARYAQRKDYHKVIRRRLVDLGRFIATRRPGVAWRTAVDTAPLLEKELAQRAGLGWIGKNTCLINRRLGSELLLGELLTDVELAVDAPEADHCGTCTACLQECPSGAFDAAYQLDARRCIAYLTIEHRSAIPATLLPTLGSHLFGCDICQAVCPWNDRAQERCATPLRARADLGHLRLEWLASLDRSGWEALVSGTPLRRLGYERCRRNVAAIAAYPLRHLKLAP